MQHTNTFDTLQGLVKDLANAAARVNTSDRSTVHSIELALMEQLTIDIYREVQRLKQAPASMERPEAPAPVATPHAQVVSDVGELRAQFARLRTEFQELEAASPIAREPVPTPPVPEPEAHKGKKEVEPMVALPVMDSSPDDQAEALARDAGANQATAPSTPPEPVQTTDNHEKTGSVHEKLHVAKQPSLHERLTKSKDAQQQINRQMAGKPIKDLTKAISINEQIVLVRELFDNDKRAFKRAVEFINKCHTFSEARSYVHHDLAKQFKNWEENNPAYESFIGLVKRRFI